MGKSKLVGGSAKNRNGGFYQHRKPVAYKPNVVDEYILVFQKPADFLIDKIIRKEYYKIAQNRVNKNLNKEDN